MTPLVSVNDLWVRYGRFEAVKGVSFEIPRGEVFGFIGPNGAGKSSTIKVLATLMKPSAGSAKLQGVEIPQFPELIRRRIGYMPDFFGVYEELTANEYLHFFAASYHVPTARRASLVDEVLELTDLGEKKHEPVDGLSRGMKQRLGIARVLLHDPELLLLDEPASGLDPRARIELRELIRALREMGKTILISSHILHELSHLCTHIGIIEAGRMVAQGSLQEIYQRLGLLRVVHVQVMNVDESMMARIRELPGVAQAQWQADRLELSLREDRVAPEDLLLSLTQLGAKVRMFQPEAMDMETAFMKLTKGQTA
jgi:ABC-2 type transport system ATP-binding protein